MTNGLTDSAAKEVIINYKARYDYALSEAEIHDFFEGYPTFS
jgi:hypothetical protein